MLSEESAHCERWCDGDGLGSLISEVTIEVTEGSSTAPPKEDATSSVAAAVAGDANGGTAGEFLSISMKSAFFALLGVAMPRWAQSSFNCATVCFS
jgi:hypothetical protein